MQFKQIVSLDGDWRFTPDPSRLGLEKRWYSPNGEPAGESVQMPHSWELMSADALQVAWYFRTFEWDGSSLQQQIALYFNAVANQADVWLNGQSLGRHIGSYTPFSFDIGDKLLPGKNHLVVRVEASSERIVGEMEKKGLIPRAGLWDHVRLEAKQSLHFKDVFV